MIKCLKYKKKDINQSRIVLNWQMKHQYYFPEAGNCYGMWVRKNAYSGIRNTYSF